MDLKLKGGFFIVGGATSGLGKGIAEHLLAEGAEILAVARSQDKLDDMKSRYGNLLTILSLDMSQRDSHKLVLQEIGSRDVTGAVFNAGGPPAGAALEVSLDQWDAAYDSVLRWKIALTNALVPRLIKAGYGRLLYIESMSVKQPVANLVLSNAMRAAVTGYVKTMSQEIASSGVTMNIMSPGFHDTAAANRVVVKNAEVAGVSVDEMKSQLINKLPMQKMGSIEDFGSLGAWLLSPHSSYLTGQSISVDGGIINSLFG